MKDNKGDRKCLRTSRFNDSEALDFSLKQQQLIASSGLQWSIINSLQAIIAISAISYWYWMIYRNSKWETLVTLQPYVSYGLPCVDVFVRRITPKPNRQRVNQVGNASTPFRNNSMKPPVSWAFLIPRADFPFKALGDQQSLALPGYRTWQNMKNIVKYPYNKKTSTEWKSWSKVKQRTMSQFARRIQLVFDLNSDVFSAA